jgi:hypothetical protein
MAGKSAIYIGKSRSYRWMISQLAGADYKRKMDDM